MVDAAEMAIEPLTGAAIGDLVRAAQPALPYPGASDVVVHLAAGNPLIALLAHRSASSGRSLSAINQADCSPSTPNRPSAM